MRASSRRYGTADYSLLCSISNPCNRDAKKIRSRLLDCLESASFPGQTEAEMDRLLNFVVVGGGPTGVEYAAELVRLAP